MMRGNLGRFHLPRRAFTRIAARALLMSIVSGMTLSDAAQAAEPAVTLFSEARNGIVTAEKATVYVKLFSWVGDPEEFQVKVRATDWNGTDIYKRDFNVKFSGNWSAPIELSMPRFGPYNITAALYKAGQKQPLHTEQARLIRVVSVPKLSREERRTSWIGVNTHADAPWQSLAAVGIHWARDYSWGWLGDGKTAPMSSNGISFAPVMQAATDAGVSILPVMQRTMYKADRSGYTDDADLVTASYERLAKAFPFIDYWELDNEPEFAFTGGRIDQENYRPFIKAAARGLEQVGNAKVVLAGTAGIRIDDTKSLVKTEGVSVPVRDAFGATSYHYYTGGLPVEAAQSNTNETGGSTSGIGTLLDAQRAVNRAAHEGGKESWLTEIGWDVSNGSAVGERLQAIYLPRVFLLSRWVGTDKVFWYFDRDVEGSREKYSTMGLFDGEWIARPSAAAMAALSQQVALAQPAGSIDLGNDRWCIALRKPEGSYVLAAWTVKGEYPLPGELTSVPAFDMFGNPLLKKKLTPEVAYFPLETLPAAWAAHTQTELASPTILRLAKGGKTTVRIEAPNGEASWISLPAGLTSTAWTRHGTQLTAEIGVAPATEVGERKITAGVRGRNWQRQWPLTVEVTPAAVVSSGPYLPGQPLQAEVKGVNPQTQGVQLALPEGTGKLEPAEGEISSDRAHAFTLLPDAATKGPIPLSVRLADGATQTEWLRPQIVEVGKTPSRYDWRYFVSSNPNFKPEVSAAWSPEGLRVTVHLPMDPAAPTNAMNFWDWT
ncbi:MAG: hypothetical protein V4671_12220, partial [Armatimonadota bacterium]